MKAGRGLTGDIRELIAHSALGKCDALVDGRAGRRSRLAGLRPYIVAQGGFGKGRFDDFASMMNTLPPAEKVKKIVSVDA
jgi:hypothetical protein